MSRPKFGRAGVLVAAVLGALFILPSSAFAAGAPTSVSLSDPGAAWQPNSIPLSGSANPNGASTTLYFEYKAKGATGYTVGGSQAIGGGTSVVKAEKKVAGLTARTNYTYRVTATNTFGSTQSGTWARNMPYWITNNKTGTASFSASGSATVTFAFGSGTVDTLKCSATGNGNLGHIEGKEDSYHVAFAGCALFDQSGKEMCKPTANPWLDFNGGFWSEATSLGLEFPESCFYERFTIPLTTPFVVGVPFEKYQVTQPVTLTNTVNAGPTVTISISTGWSMTGADAGHLFGLTEG